ncbi:MAG: TIGR02453 family protein [Bacteroidetes bacterium 4484_249]|nr:MAG: TIGR02453 family protein [Bacteroidetes bacterium 4484_249]
MNMKTVLDFLTSLRENNTRNWFNDNKAKYETAKKEFEDLLNLLIPAVYNFDPFIGTITPKQCIFRIYRDVRFSKDKSPYKTNMGGFISKGSRNGGFAGYYVHIEPGKSFLGGGLYMPASDDLKKVRQEILYNIEEFKKIISKKTFKKTFKEIEGEKLKRPPKDFPADFPDIELLKYKSYVVLHELTDKKILSTGFNNYIIDVFKEMYPLNKFLNTVLS